MPTVLPRFTLWDALLLTNFLPKHGCILPLDMLRSSSVFDTFYSKFTSKLLEWSAITNAYCISSLIWPKDC